MSDGVVPQKMKRISVHFFLDEDVHEKMMGVCKNHGDFSHIMRELARSFVTNLGPSQGVFKEK